jgi:outer membrane protein OmpA-like peptidoglycan-associated protein
MQVCGMKIRYKSFVSGLPLAIEGHPFYRREICLSDMLVSTSGEESMTRNSLTPHLTAMLCGSVMLTAAALAQEPNPTSVPAPAREAVVTQNGDIFFYKVRVVQQDFDAVNYLHRSGSTKVAFEGLGLPNARGEAEVKSERGKIMVDAEFKGLTPANGFGPDFLTYVLWAISPDGRPVNLGEVLPAGTKSNLSVSVPLQAFALIVTAEPYYAVSTPSDVVVMKNVYTDQTNGVLEKVKAHTSLYPRGLYSEATDGAHTVSRPVTRDERSPLELYEAYNAVRIAQQAGAEKYSPDIYAKANLDLKNAADLDSAKGRDKKMEVTYARQAVERAEDARVDTLRKQAAERQRNAELARNRAQDEAAASAAQAQQSQAQAQQSAMQAEQAKLETDRAMLAKQQADAERAKAEAEAAEARARAAEANKQVVDANKVREQLRNQLNSVLETSESARGLIVNMSDVLFDTGKYSLKQGTQVSLAKVAGILQAYPGLKVQVEGFTDSVGGDDYNQKLSENRANGVMNFLVSQGVQQDHIMAKGYGKGNPVADNGTPQGRQQNRRVNLVVSGDAIGIQQQAEPSGN